MKALVSIVMGSKSDLKVMKDAIKVLQSFKVKTEVKVVSAHRTPQFMQEYALATESRGVAIIIAGAGGAAHLPGMIASLTCLTVIGVPISVGQLNGLDSLLSIAQMPKGVPVATVAVNNSFNAGLLAVRILAGTDKKLRAGLRKFHLSQKKKVLSFNRKLSHKKSVKLVLK